MLHIVFLYPPDTQKYRLYFPDIPDRPCIRFAYKGRTGSVEVCECGRILQPVLILESREVMLGNGQTRMSQALRNEGKGCPVTLENCGERVPCGVCGEGRDAYLPGYLLQRQVTQVYDLPHKVGGAEVILCRACVRENICIGVTVVRRFHRCSHYRISRKACP